MPRGRKALGDIRQVDLPVQEQNSRLFSFRLNRRSGDENEKIARDICDKWMETDFKAHIIAAILNAKGIQPTSLDIATSLLLDVRDTLQIEHDYIKRLLKELIRADANIVRSASQRIYEEDGIDFPAGFEDAMLGGFDNE